MDSDPIIHPPVDYVLIPLKNSKGITKVSPEDVELAQSYNWHSSRGYAITVTNKKTYYLHRLILNPPDSLFTDHINGDRLDNRRSNLRIATASQNRQNAAGKSSGRRSRYKGVMWYERKDKWFAQITVNGRIRHIAYYHSEENAARAYDNAALFYFGQFARTNFSDAVPMSIEEIRARHVIEYPVGFDFKFAPYAISEQPATACKHLPMALSGEAVQV
jgi:hypothetical protein